MTDGETKSLLHQEPTLSPTDKKIDNDNEEPQTRCGSVANAIRALALPVVATLNSPFFENRPQLQTLLSLHIVNTVQYLIAIAWMTAIQTGLQIHFKAKKSTPGESFLVKQPNLKALISSCFFQIQFACLQFPYALRKSTLCKDTCAQQEPKVVREYGWNICPLSICSKVIEITKIAKSHCMHLSKN